MSANRANDGPVERSTSGDSFRAELRRVAAFCPGYNLRRADKTVTRWFDEEFRGAPITVAQFTMLLNLALESPLSIGELSDRLSSEVSTTSRNMDSLITRAFVELRPQLTDRRRREYALTREGHNALLECLPRWKAAQKRTMERVGRARWMVALSALKRFYES